MNSNDRNQNRTDATEDDDFGDFEGPEDDAPECVQAMGGPPNWVFPDLLRVQTSQTSHEEPESVLNNNSSALNQSIRPNVLTRVNDIRGATGRETGAIPKQRALDPPDVSLLTNTTQPKLPTHLDLCSSALRTNYSRDSSAIPSTAQSSTSPLISETNNTLNGSIDSNQLRITQLERDLNSIQTQKALLQQQLLQKDTQIRELTAQSRQSVPNLIPVSVQDTTITALTETVEKFRSTIETAINRLEQRLNVLESKVVVNHSSVDCDSLANNTNGCQPLNHSLNSLLAQQRIELEAERRRNLSLFASVLKTAVEGIETHLDGNRVDTNHQ